MLIVVPACLPASHRQLPSRTSRLKPKTAKKITTTDGQGVMSSQGYKLKFISAVEELTNDFVVDCFV